MIPNPGTGDTGSRAGWVEMIISVGDSLNWSFCRHPCGDMKLTVGYNGLELGESSRLGIKSYPQKD